MPEPQTKNDGFLSFSDTKTTRICIELSQNRLTHAANETALSALFSNASSHQFEPNETLNATAKPLMAKIGSLRKTTPPKRNLRSTRWND